MRVGNKLVTVATIDPGIRGSGIAIWDLRTWEKNPVPLSTHVITPPSSEDWVKAISTIYDEVEQIFDQYNVHKTYCEMPQYFSGAVGHAATADGNIYKLSCLVGVFMGIMLEKGSELVPIEVITWKGQLPKDVVISRLKKIDPRLEKMGIKSHAWDAVGIGFYVQKRFNR